jgi:hypothetical protein
VGPAAREPSWAPPGRLRYSLALPWPTPSNNLIKGLHFHAYKHLRRKWSTALKLEMLRLRAPPALPVYPAFLVVHRHCSGAGLDWDNAYGGLKPLLDCLVCPSNKNPDGLGLIQDDNPSAMPLPPLLRQTRAPPGKGHTLVEIFEINTARP